MANTIITHQMLAREAVAMLKEDTFIKTINTGRSDEFTESVNGYKKGDFVDIGVPPTPVVFSGASFAGGGSAPDQTETKVRLQLSKQKHVPLTFTAKEKLLNISDFKDRFLRPAMQALLSVVQADILLDMKNATPNVVGTWGTIPATRTPYANARARLQKLLAPSDNRCVQFTSDANALLVEANATLFNKSAAVSESYAEGSVGDWNGLTFFENQSIPVHTNGAGASYAVNGASQTGTSLVLKTGTGAMPKGTVFTLAGVNAVHPITGADMGYLRQFVLTADYAGGAGTASIYPAITPTTATLVGTVTASPADSAAVTVFGTASTSAAQNLCYHKNAFAAAFAPLPVLASCEGYTASIGGISVRVMTFGNGQTDTESTRIDVLYGNAAPRPDHSVRITQ
jgi:hypothetical protein